MGSEPVQLIAIKIGTYTYFLMKKDSVNRHKMAPQRINFYTVRPIAMKIGVYVYFLMEYIFQSHPHCCSWPLDGITAD